MNRQVYRVVLLLFSLSLLVVTAQAQSNMTAKSNGFQPAPAAGGETERARDGLLGPVRRIRTETVKVSAADGKLVEDGKHVLLETAEYDLKGSKIQNQYFPVSGSTPTGREVYKYDDKGNISEMTLTGTDGSLISKEVYKYDFDSMGNWVKMTTSVAVVGNGAISFEPTEVTTRTIFYYLDATMAKMLEPASSSPAPAKTEKVQTPAGSSAVNNSSTVTQNVNDKIVKPLPPSMSMARVSFTSGQPMLPDLRNARVGGNDKVMIADTDTPPAPRAPAKAMSAGVLNGNAISLPPPVYPNDARRLRISGVVQVEVSLDENGHVLSARALSGPLILRDAAVKAAYQAKFTPTKLSGLPVKVTGQINYKFTIPD